MTTRPLKNNRNTINASCYQFLCVIVNTIVSNIVTGRPGVGDAPSCSAHVTCTTIIVLCIATISSKNPLSASGIPQCSHFTIGDILFYSWSTCKRDNKNRPQKKKKKPYPLEYTFPIKSYTFIWHFINARLDETMDTYCYNKYKMYTFRTNGIYYGSIILFIGYSSRSRYAKCTSYTKT